MNPTITLATATYDDSVGLQMFLQSSVLHQDLQDVELLVVDNHPTTETKGGKTHLSKQTAGIKSYVENLGGRYIPLAEPVGTAVPRNRCVTEASGDVVVVCDSHVILGRDTLNAIRRHFADHPDSLDLITGPQLGRQRMSTGDRDLVITSTHYADVWRAGMWGIWSQAWGCPCGRWNFDVGAVAPEHGLQLDATGAILAMPPVAAMPTCQYHALALGRPAHTHCPECGQELPDRLPYLKHEQALQAAGYLRRGWSAIDSEPFEVPGHGLGFFAVRKAAWTGFPETMRGFGGGELHLAETFRRQGGRCLCLPQAKWWHLYERSNDEGKVPYPLRHWDIVRNYVLWRRHLDWPLDPVRVHFVDDRRVLNAAEWEYLIADPVGNTDRPTRSAASVATPPTPKGQRPQPPATASSVAEIYSWICAAKRDCVSHLPTIHRLAREAHTVVACVKRREWDAAVLAAEPGLYFAHVTEPDPLQDRLRAAAHTPYDLDTADSLTCDLVDCDLLILDTIHSADRLRAELARWLPHCRRWIAIRGTKHFGETAEGSEQPGLAHAIRDLSEAADPTWRRVYQEDTQYGLTVLSCDPAERSIDRGVGYELSRLYKSLGINPPQNCTCRALAREMDALGPAGCRGKEDDLLKRMAENAAKYKWTDSLKAGIRALTSGLAFQINPLDPLRSCLRIACDRAEAEESAWQESQRKDA